MPGTVVMLHNPFRPERDREVIAVTALLSIREWLDEQGIDEFECPTICLRNASPVLRGRWDETEIGENDLVVFVPLPQGGGGGGKNPLRTVLMLAVMVAAVYFAPIIGTAIGVTSTTGVALIQAGLALVGAALVNVLIPPPKPSAVTANFGSAPAPSPTYSLQAQGNHARLAQPIPVVYGRHRVYPDLAATPWVEYSGNDQVLHQLHCIGQGEYDLEQVRIEDTPIASFEEIDTEIVVPGGAVSLFEADVVTAPEIAGQELIGQNDREAGDDGWIGPFTANPAGTRATEIGIDVVMPRGLYYATASGSFSARTVEWEVEARAIDEKGEAAGEWLAVASESVTAATNTPQRKSYRYTVAAGRYEVRARRTNDKSGDARAGHEIRWGGLKTFLEGAPAFGAVTLLAVRMRATDNLSQRSARLVNAIVTRRLPVWDPATGWSAPQPTRSLAWAFADAARATYGAGLADARIDLAALHALDQVWQSRGDRFDAVFDQGLTVWEALTRIARCGRALPFLQGGVLRIARDAPHTLPVALFGPAQHRQGQFPRPVRHAGRGHRRCGDGDLLLRAHLGARRSHGSSAGERRRGHRQARHGRAVRLHRRRPGDARGSLYGRRQPLPAAHNDLPHRARRVDPDLRRSHRRHPRPAALGTGWRGDGRRRPHARLERAVGMGSWGRRTPRPLPCAASPRRESERALAGRTGCR